MGYFLIALGVIILGLSLLSQKKKTRSWHIHLLNGLVITLAGIYFVLVK
jgi:hypothetical membrane protein